MTSGDDAAARPVSRSPGRARHARWFVWFAISLVLALLIHWFEFKGFFAGAEGKVADSYLSADTAVEPRLRVLTVSIDDTDYLSFFGATSPLDAAALMELVAGVRQAMPLVIGVDILTDSDDFKNSAYARAAQLNAARARLGKNADVPVVWAASATVKPGKAQRFVPWLLGAHEELVLEPGRVLGEPAPGDSDTWGVPIFPTEHDRAVRRLPRRWAEHPHHEGILQLLMHLFVGPSGEESGGRTFAGAVVDPYCRSANPGCKSYRLDKDEKDDRVRQVPAGREIFISYGSDVSVTPDYFVRDLFECTTPAPPAAGHRRLCESWEWNADREERAHLAGSIVLIGGTFEASRDFFETPSGQRTAGLFVNAHAIRAEIDGPVVSELPPLVTLALDVAVGLFITLIFSHGSHLWMGSKLRRFPAIQAWVSARPDHMEWRVIATALLGLVVALMSYVLFRMFHFLWVSWVGMLLAGVSLHIVTETRHMRLKH